MKTYGLEKDFTADQARKYDGWRQTLIAKVDANDTAYMRPVAFDALLSVRFPEMSERINEGYGRLPDQK